MTTKGEKQPSTFILALKRGTISYVMFTENTTFSSLKKCSYENKMYRNVTLVLTTHYVLHKLEGTFSGLEMSSKRSFQTKSTLSVLYQDGML